MDLARFAIVVEEGLVHMVALGLLATFCGCRARRVHHRFVALDFPHGELTRREELIHREAGWRGLVDQTRRLLLGLVLLLLLLFLVLLRNDRASQGGGNRTGPDGILVVVVVVVAIARLAQTPISISGQMRTARFAASGGSRVERGIICSTSAWHYPGCQTARTAVGRVLMFGRFGAHRDIEGNRWGG